MAPLPLIHPLFTDHAVLQREQPIPIWGWVSPGERVAVSLGGHALATTAGPDGRWQVTVPALAAGGPYRLGITASGGSQVELHDILVGEVWLCSGQSNMEWPAQSPSGLPEPMFAQAAQHPDIRLFHLPKVSAMAPQATVSARWQPSDVDALSTFSAIGFAFGLELHRKLGVPVGLIHSAWGGTLAEVWTSREALASEPALAPILARIPAKLVSRTDPAYQTMLQHWRDTAFHVDAGRAPGTVGWELPDHDDSAWQELDVPGYWETQGWDMDGAVWYRRQVEVPEEWIGRDLQLSLGPVDDFDDTFVNGERVGGLHREDNYDAYAVPRSYVVPGRVVSGTRVCLAVRVFDHMGNGGFAGSAMQMRLHLVGGGPAASVPLSGRWKARIELRLKPRPWTPPPPCAEEAGSAPAGLYNAMIAPLIPFPMRGVIWYQGESNAGRAEQYRTLLPLLVRDWRSRWGRELHFLTVQLCSFKPRNTSPMESDWAELREAQALAMDSLAATGLAVTIDSGDAQDIHPANKPLVAHRLALLARAQVYGEDISSQGPVLRDWKRVGERIRCTFDHAEGLCALGGVAQGFSIAGSDRRFLWAQVRIDAKAGAVEVWHPDLHEPTSVRYGWADNPAVSLVNASSLPMRPFRTDTWPGITAGQA